MRGGGLGLRTVPDIRALDDGIRARLMAAFEVPAAWKPEARIQATIPVLQGCRDSAWASPPISHTGRQGD